LTTIPALIMRAWTASADLGIVRMNQTTRQSFSVSPLFQAFDYSLGRRSLSRPCSIAKTYEDLAFLQ
jgi:hypothetical protein